MADVIATAKNTVGGKWVADDTGYVMGFVYPKDMALEPAQELNARPRHRKAHITLSTLEAFRDYVLRYWNMNTGVVYADPSKRQLTCVFDDYPMAGGPAWRFHRAILTLTTSPELTAWKELEAYKSQDFFAEFLNLHASQIVEPAAADILEIVTQFEAVEQAALTSKTRARDGRVQFAFSRESKVLSVDIPGELMIRIPLFTWAPAVELTAQIRFRIKDRGLHFCLVFPDLPQQLTLSWTQSLDALRVALPQGSLIVEGQP